MICKGCNIDQDKNIYKVKLFLTSDGYCTNCNHKFRDRKRIVVGMDNFVATKIIKESKYDHLTGTGRKWSAFEIAKKKYGSGTIMGNYNRQKILAARIRKIEEWI